MAPIVSKEHFGIIFNGSFSSSAVSHLRRPEFFITGFVNLKTCVTEIHLLLCKIFVSAVSCHITVKSPRDVSFVAQSVGMLMWGQFPVERIQHLYHRS